MKVSLRSERSGGAAATTTRLLEPDNETYDNERRATKLSAMVTSDQQRKALGAFIRSQRELANLSLRRMASLSEVSNPYLSQIERGLHEPSVRILRSIAQALNLSAETLLGQAGLLDDDHAEMVGTELAIRADPDLTAPQKQALLAVYRSYRATNQVGDGAVPD
jgi:transcriptional regulator with XRE-family HTH domain